MIDATHCIVLAVSKCRLKKFQKIKIVNYEIKIANTSK